MVNQGATLDDVRKRNRKPARRKGSGLSPRARPPAGTLGPLAEFTRNLAASIQGNLFGRPKRAAPARRLTPVRALRTPSTAGPISRIAARVLTMKLTNPIEAIEIALLSQAMFAAHGNISAAARLLGMHRKSVERHLAKHGL